MFIAELAKKSPKIYANTIEWSKDNMTVLCSCSDLVIREVDMNDILMVVKQQDIQAEEDGYHESKVESYEIRANTREVVVKIRDTSAASLAVASAGD